jgi:hypothetical protein
MQIFVKTGAGRQRLPMNAIIFERIHCYVAQLCGSVQLVKSMACAPAFDILAVRLSVFAGVTHLFEVGPSTTVADVKALVQTREGEYCQATCSQGTTGATPSSSGKQEQH